MSKYYYSYKGETYLLTGAPHQLPFEEGNFYAKAVNRRAKVEDGWIYFPRMFGVPAWSHDLAHQSQLQSSPFFDDEEDEEEEILAPKHNCFIYLSNIAPRDYSRPLVKVTDFTLHFRKVKSGFTLLLNLNKSGDISAHLPNTHWDWEEFALYMRYVLSHGKVYYNPLMKELFIEACLGVQNTSLKLQ